MSSPNIISLSLSLNFSLFMASPAKQFALFIVLITLLSSLHITHARDITSFNKASSTTNNNVVPNNKEEPLVNNQQENEPSFLPQNENSYGLYGQKPAELTPSATTSNGGSTTTAESKPPLHKYLPKNYNPVAYVTEPEDMSDSTPFTEQKSFTSINNPYSNNNFYSGAENYYNNQQEEESSEYRSFNSQPQGGLSNTRFRGGATLNSRHNYFNGGANYGFQPQGMSDTRFLENGKYFYDINAEKYSSNHPYESLKGVRPRNEYYNNRNYYGNSENEYEFNGGVNSMVGYQNQDEEFQVEENNLP